jgi:RimJ/RimL family protein N-acetyltransferase
VTVDLRRVRQDDADFLLELITDDETRPFLGGRAGETRDAVLAEIERSESEPDAFGWFVIEADDEPAGCVAFHRVNERNRIAEASRFAIQPRFRNRGIGTKAALRFQRYLIRELGFHRIELQVYGFNERAVAHAEQCGYVREGVKRKAYLKDGEWQDAVLFSLLQEELTDE